MIFRFRFLPLIIFSLAVIIAVVSCEDENLDSSFDQIILSSQDEVLVDAANNFGFDLLKFSQTVKSNENVIISPLEISSNLNLLLNGSTGSTYALINSQINPSNLSVNTINNSYKRILEVITNLSDEKILLLNGFWFKSGIGLNSQFENIGSYFYKTHIDSVDFSAATDINQIETWLSTHSQNQLKFPDYEISTQTQSLLINGFTCSLNLKYSFEERINEVFWRSESDTATISMLKLTASLKSFSNDYFTLVEIPYSNSNFSLLVLLAKQNVSLQSILPVVNSANWDYWIKSSVKTTMALTLPELDLSESFDIGECLENASYGYLSAETAEFDNITTNQDFKIDYLFSHSNFRILDDRLSYSKLDDYGDKTMLYNTQILVNKPFLFAIKENSSNLVLLTGIIKNPYKKN